MPKSLGDIPQKLRPYIFHRVELDWTGDSDAIGTCPFCRGEGKLFISQQTGQYDCKTCDAGQKGKSGGNLYNFLRRLHEASTAPMAELEEVAAERRLKVGSLQQWGLVKSIIDGEWILPSYSPKKEITNLYRWAMVKRGKGWKRTLLTTATLDHGLFGLQFWEPDKPEAFVDEGPWDAIALWERFQEEGRTTANVVGVPGCETFLDSWVDTFRSKKVFVCYDSDYPKRYSDKHPKKGELITKSDGSKTVPGFDGAKHAARQLYKVAASVNYLDWGPEGYDGSLPDGYDVRDLLTAGDPKTQMLELLSRIKSAPPDWFTDITPAPCTETLPPLPCESYDELKSYWEQAMYWTDTLDITLTTMLAVVASTKLQGSQVWLRIIGPAGSAKTTLCEAIVLNRQYAQPMSIITGFHSGYSGPGAGEDASPILKILNKTAVINEGDMILKAPNREQTMAEMRDFYSGVARNQYRTGIANEYTGIRCTFIIAGTPAIRLLNKSALGDRFLDIIIYERERGVATNSERQLVMATLDKEMTRLGAESDGKPESHDSPEKNLAYQKTAGYINYLRSNVLTKINSVIANTTVTDKDDFWKLGHLTALMRTRKGEGDEDKTEPELATRLSSQFLRLGLCLAVVMNKDSIDREVMRRVATVAKDTCFGHTFEVASLLTRGELDIRSIAVRLSLPEDKVRKALGILVTLGCVRVDLSTAESGATRRNFQVYRVTPQLFGLLSRLRILLDNKAPSPITKPVCP